MQHGIIIRTFQDAQRAADEIGGVVVGMSGVNFVVQRHGGELLNTPDVFEVLAFLRGWQAAKNA